jgi:hypothetical protein
MTTKMVHRVNPDLEERADEDLSALVDESIDVAPIQPAESRAAFEAVSPSLSDEDVVRFRDWNDQYGTG